MGYSAKKVEIFSIKNKIFLQFLSKPFDLASLANIVELAIFYVILRANDSQKGQKTDLSRKYCWPLGGVK